MIGSSGTGHWATRQIRALLTLILLLWQQQQIHGFMAPPEAFVESVLNRTSGQSYCSPSGQIGDSCCDFETVESISNALHPQLIELVQTPFFSHYKIDLFKGCPFWKDNFVCVQKDCAVETVDEVS